MTMAWLRAMDTTFKHALHKHAVTWLDGPNPEPLSNHGQLLLVGIYRGIESFHGFVGGAGLCPSTSINKLGSLSPVAVPDCRKAPEQNERGLFPDHAGMSFFQGLPELVGCLRIQLQKRKNNISHHQRWADDLHLLARSRQGNELE